VNPRKYSVSSVGPRIEKFLGGVLEKAGFRMDYHVSDGQAAEDDFETPDVVVKFSGPDVECLLGNRAELVLELEHLTMAVLRMPSEDHSRVLFDANDYRLLRIEELRLSAAAAAEKVKRTGEPFRFNPMNSRERRVIHLSLRNETTLRSESSGSGGYRQVVVYPAGMASLPELPQPAFVRRDGPPAGGDRRPFGRERGSGGGGRPPRRGDGGGPRR
jgi:spoIIIJ-associated protein